MINILIKYCIPNPAQRHNAAFMSGVSFSLYTYLINVVTFSFYAAMFLSYFDFASGAMASFITALLQLSLFPILRKTKSTEFSNILLIVSSMTTNIFFSFSTGGLTSPCMIWLAVYPLAGAAFGSKRYSVIALAINCLTIGTFITMNQYGFVFPQMISGDKLWVFQCMAIIGVAVSTAVLSYLYIENINTANQKFLEEKHRYLNLLRTITHDIASPLAIIDGNAQLLQWLEGSDPVLLERVEKIRRSIKITSSILKNVSDIDALESGKKDFKLVEVNLYNVFENTYFLYSDKLRNKKITLHHNLDQFRNLQVVAEEISLGCHVFGNLLSNAIKFSEPSGQIEVLLSDRQEEVMISFRDHGIGIPQRLLKKLFHAESQTNRPGTKGEKGTGFGMPIVKSYVEKYGGKIEISSRTPNKGGPHHHSGTEVRIILKKPATVNRAA
jgi:signal transduction histidine kinase